MRLALKKLRLRLIGMVLFLVTLQQFCPLSIMAQHFQLPEHQRRELIPFKMIRNLMVIPLKINGQGPFNFVLDSGVGLVLISDAHLADSLKLNYLRSIKIVGLGGDNDLDAYITEPLTLSVGRALGDYIPTAVLQKDVFNLSQYVGMPIHGLLGYEFFSSFITKINYDTQTITLFPPRRAYFPRKGYRIPITIEERKPYLEAQISFDGKSTQKVKLVIDSGAGHPVSLESNNGIPFAVPDVNIAGNLGVGLAGPISGYFGRIPSMKLGKYELKQLIAAFPNYDDVGAKIRVSGRNGNLGNQVLKRFEIVFDYGRSALYLKPSSAYKERFEHDMSGMEFVITGPDYKRLIVSRVEPDSPAETDGIEAGDEILSINLKPVKDYTVEEIDNLFKSGNDRSFLLHILPKDSEKIRKVIFTLKRRI